VLVVVVVEGLRRVAVFNPFQDAVCCLLVCDVQDLKGKKRIS
jgi:hypothetical protein